MNAQDVQRRPLPVAQMRDLDPLQSDVVQLLRLWWMIPNARQDIEHEFSPWLGPQRAKVVCDSFDQLCALCVTHGRLSVRPHALHCGCVGGKEACFANFIAAAADGQREEAMFTATLLTRTDMAPMAAALAEVVGLALKQMSLRCTTYPKRTGTYSQALH